MSVPAVYLQEAEDEMAIAQDGYEQQQPGLGNQFVDSV